MDWNRWTHRQLNQEHYNSMFPHGSLPLQYMSMPASGASSTTGDAHPAAGSCQSSPYFLPTTNTVNMPMQYHTNLQSAGGTGIPQLQFFSGSFHQGNIPMQHTAPCVPVHPQFNGWLPTGGYFWDYNSQQQVPFIQRNNGTQVMGVRTPFSVHGNNHITQPPFINPTGSFQELLRSVSTTTYNGSNQADLVKETVDVQTVGHDVVVHSAASIDDAEDASESEVEEEESNDADDEDDSDSIIDTRAGYQTNLSVAEGSLNTDNYLQYEMAPIKPNGNGGIKKRRRFPKGYEVPDYRPPRCIGTIEKAMRNAPKRPPGTNIFEPKIGMVFDSRAEMYNFYNLYSWEVGFGIRFGGFARNRVNKMRTMQEVVCQKEGFDRRNKNSSQRMRCPAKIRLHRTQDLGWYISRHVAKHNHPLSLSLAEKREWNSHSKIEECTKKMIGYLRENNVSISNVHCFVGSMYGGMKNVPFNPKSIRSVCTEIARDQRYDDITKTVELFRKMREQDPGFQFSVDLDSDKRVNAIMWASGRSRSQYNFFGDAITFDTTYCTNIYNMPFGMFVGVNNHFQSIMYAGVLMTKEDTESFKWVFKEFNVLMGGKWPVTIFTDQCKAMTKAIKEVFPASCTHLWCKWHVLRYAPEQIGPVYNNNGPFQLDFHYIISQMLTVDEFEMAWEYLLDTYDLRDNEFMQRTYAKRHRWAKPWAKNIFCARMATTQRSESANSVLKKVVPRNASMNKFVQQYDKLLFMRYIADQKAEHDTKQFVHRTKRMYALEKHAITVYTKKCFELFSEEVDKATEYDVEEGEEEGTYIATHTNAETRKKWARVSFRVVVEGQKEKFSCECGQYNHFGMLCCHAIKVMMHCKVRKIPKAHIMKRWTRDARDYEYQNEPCGSAGQELGQSLLYANALDVVTSTSKHPDAGHILNKYLNIARKEIEGLGGGNTVHCPDSDGDITTGYTSEQYTETEIEGDCGFGSDGQPLVKNVYGASGSSAYMSDADINKIQAPKITPRVGRKRVKRIKPLFERTRRGRKKYTGTPVLFRTDQDEENMLGVHIADVVAQKIKLHQ